MADVARNINYAFDRGYQEFFAGCKTWQNPYQARYARNAWRAGWEKANKEYLEPSEVTIRRQRDEEWR